MRSSRADTLRILAAAASSAAEILQSEEVEHAPVPVERIAGRLGAEVVTTPMFSDASLSRHGTALTIRINARQGPTRRRFSVAHEIGHIVWEKRVGGARPRVEGEGIDETFQGTQLEERFCDVFASHLLIPADDLAWLCDWGAFSISDTEEAAKRFGVSLSTLMRRITENAPGDGGAVWLDSNRSRHGLTIKWAVFPKRPSFRYDPGEILPFVADLYRFWRAGDESYIPEYALKVGNFSAIRPIRAKFAGESVALAVFPERDAVSRNP